MTKLRRLELANLCYAVVSSLFAEFLCEKNRGQEFKWSTSFPKVSRSACITQAFLQGNLSNKEIELIDKYSDEISHNLLSRSGLLDKGG
jgi:hypothetical protein